MPYSIYLAVSAAALAGLAQLASAQTNVTASACVEESVYSDCNHNVYSCEYQLFVQQYFAVCPSATEPIPFWPAPDNAPNRCSCSLGKVLTYTLSARKEQSSCVENITNQALNNIPDLSNLGNIPNIARTATDCACCGASASMSSAWEICPNTIPTLAGANLWPLFFPSAYPNLYTSIPNFAWSGCDDILSKTDCASLGFSDSNNKFYRPGDFPKNGTSTLHNVAGTVTAPPSGTVITWSQASATYTVTATGVDKKVVAGGGSASGTGTGTGSEAAASATQSANAAVLRGVGSGGLVGLVVGGLMVM
ncbi:hypothetical protein PoHVEF18_008964 [Penicillium ochrochloron]